MDLTIQRKLIAILKIIRESRTPIGARLIADRMNLRGYAIGERAVRYHLHILDERGLTKRLGYDGRVITGRGIDELNNALVGDRVGFIITKTFFILFPSISTFKTYYDLFAFSQKIIELFEEVFKSFSHCLDH